MEAVGFKPNRMEWWHYELPRTRSYPVLDLPFDTATAAGDR
jgi:D-alanyl-D-alanine dipeptidase